MKSTIYITLIAFLLIGSGILSSCKSKSTDQETTSPTSNGEEVDEIKFSKDDAQQAIQEIFTKQAAIVREKTTAEMEAKVITYKEFKMPYDYITYGEEPEGGHSLYISLHGGGEAPAHVNDGQWKNQIKLYQPKEGIYLAPRAATNTWDLWHQEHIDPMFDILIGRFIAHHGINPNKVYVMGYSAGGDGVYQIGPRMADRWAAAAMMAGHPNETQPHNLINLPFIIQCGGKDAAHNRNTRCIEWGEMLGKLAKENPGHYPHKCIIYPEHGHWMNLDCKQALPWMAEYTRDPWPKKINWHQDNVTNTRFYWLANSDPKPGDLVTAEVIGQIITITTENVKKLTLRLNDKLIDLDKEIIVKDSSGKELFKGKIERSPETITKSLTERLDPANVATAELEVSFE